jgi:hypothetical protein
MTKIFGRVGLPRRSTTICWRNTKTSASSAALDRTRKIIRTVLDERQRVKGRKIDWPEWRVGVFMGAFIVPLDRLASAVARQAGAMDLPFRWRTGPNGLPLPSIAGDRDADMIDCLVESLADKFGVSPAFMAVRLKKGGFVAPYVITFGGRA